MEKNKDNIDMMEDIHYGPILPISEEIHAMKYRARGETFKEAMARISGAVADNEEHRLHFKAMLYNMRFLPAGRVQSAVGSPRFVTPFNCFVSGTIEDCMNDIMAKAGEAATTMRLGGGIGYDFSTLRPRGDLIKSLDSKASGPVSFMQIFDAVCKTIASAGHRRGAQMAVLRVDHPDIEEFINAKKNENNLTQFNISVGVTNEFMEAVKADTSFDLRFNNRVYKTIKAKALWDEILRNTWDWSEPGVLFIDRINEKNNLKYCETIAATNPCAEQPLPPYGACLLGSFNLTKYVLRHYDTFTGTFKWSFDWDLFKRDIPVAVRAMDNVIDLATYPLPQQEQEAKRKRRMGLGITGLANAAEVLGFPYGTAEFYRYLREVLGTLRDTAYETSVDLAVEKGPFELFDPDQYGQHANSFLSTLPIRLQERIKREGLRNSHLLSIAPTGTISLTADNVSSGLEPVFSYSYNRTIQTFDGPKKELVTDYGYRNWDAGKPNGPISRPANELSVFDHVTTLNIASQYIDSACSKTCNVGDEVTWDEFKNVYMEAYEGGSSGCTTFRAAGKRNGVLNASNSEDVAEDSKEPEESPKDFVDEGGACYFDVETGRKSCE